MFLSSLSGCAVASVMILLSLVGCCPCMTLLAVPRFTSMWFLFDLLLWISAIVVANVYQQSAGAHETVVGKTRPADLTGWARLEWDFNSGLGKMTVLQIVLWVLFALTFCVAALAICRFKCCGPRRPTTPIVDLLPRTSTSSSSRIPRGEKESRSSLSLSRTQTRAPAYSNIETGGGGGGYGSAKSSIKGSPWTKTGEGSSRNGSPGPGSQRQSGHGGGASGSGAGRGGVWDVRASNIFEMNGNGRN